MEKYLIAVDMDGTLLNSQGKMTERTAKTLQKVIDAGHLLVPATGRALPLLPKEILSLSGIQYAILENGAVVWDWKNASVLAQKKLPAELVREILCTSQKFSGHCYMEIFCEGKAYAELSQKKILPDARIEGDFIDYMMHNHAFVENLPSCQELLLKTEKINLYFEDPDSSALFRKQWAGAAEVDVTTSVAGNAEFNAAGISKGTGLALLKSRLSLPENRLIAIGDNENDLEMFKVSGHSAAMGNAADNIKAAAGYVTLDNDRDGAAVFLEKFL